VRRLAASLGLVMVMAASASAGLCDGRYRGAAIDIDVKGASLADVFRLLADAGHTSLVIGEDIQGSVTLHLHHVPWDQVACTVAAMHQLELTFVEQVIIVTKRRHP
jgi:type II secretory pathway component HofQ